MKNSTEDTVVNYRRTCQTGGQCQFFTVYFVSKKEKSRKEKKRVEKRQGIIRNTDMGGRIACKSASHGHPGAQKVV